MPLKEFGAELRKGGVLPRAFHEADQWAIDHQSRHVRMVKAHLLAGVVGASVAQVAFSLSGHPGFVCALALCILALLVTRILVVQRPRWEQIWCRSRAAAEQVRSLSWAYMMGVDHVGIGGAPPCDRQTVKAATEATIRQIRQEWLEAAKIESGSPVAESEITPPMDKLRSSSYMDKLGYYLEFRLKDQLTWYKEKSEFNHRRRSVFLAIAILWEVLAAAIAVTILLQTANLMNVNETLVGNLPTFLWLCMTGATAAAGWSSFRRYAELANTYNRSAEQLEAILRDCDKLAVDTPATRQAFARCARECEELLTRENALWFSRRTMELLTRNQWAIGKGTA